MFVIFLNYCIFMTCFNRCDICDENIPRGDLEVHRRHCEKHLRHCPEPGCNFSTRDQNEALKHITEGHKHFAGGSIENLFGIGLNHFSFSQTFINTLVSRFSKASWSNSLFSKLSTTFKFIRVNYFLEFQHAAGHTVSLPLLSQYNKILFYYRRGS